MSEIDSVKNLIKGLRDKYKDDACVIAYLEVIITLEARLNPEFKERIDFHIRELPNENW